MAAEKEQYIVSARKYRPQTFDTVIGQQHITTTLKNAIKTNHLAHAYLFCGPRGVGKTTCARILARTLNCENPAENMEACGECTTCKAFKTNSALNVFELDAASNNSVEDIRRLTEEVRYAPQHGKYKVYIIDEVHMLSPSAFNAFLKTLEEPPSYAIFILATTEKHKILPTILSRCQIFDFKRIKPEEIVLHLKDIIGKENLTAEDAALHIIAQKSEGCMRDALSMMDRLMGFSTGTLTYQEVIEHLSILDATSYFRLSEMLWTKDIPGVLLFLDELLQKGFEGDLILDGFSNHFRNLLLCRELRMAKLLELPEEHKKQFYEHARLLSDSYILSALSVLNDAALNYKTALNKRLHTELCLLKLSYLNELISTESGTPSFQSEAESKKKLKSVNPAVKKPELPDRQPLATMEESASTLISAESTSMDELQKAAPVAVSSIESVVKEPEILPSPLSTVGGVPQLKSRKNYLNAIQQKIELQEVKEKQQLTKALAEKLFGEFKEKLHETNLMLSEQMGMMQLQFLDAENMELLCNSEINFSYGKDGAKQLRLFLKKETGQTALRVRAVLDPAAKPDFSQNHIKSKQEILEEFLQKNEALRKLKQDLNLTIEY